MATYQINGKKYQIPDDVHGEKLQETLMHLSQPQITEDQLRAAGAVPGIAITPEQEKIIRAGGKITPREPRLKGGKFEEFQPPLSGTQGESFGRGFKTGMQAIGGGVLKGVASLTGNEGLKEDLEHSITIENLKNKGVSKDFPLTNLGGQIAGEIAATPTLGPFGQTRTARIVTGTGTGAAAGALSASGRNEDTINSALLGAGFGAGFTGLSETGKQLAAKMANSKGGNFKSEDVAELVRLAKEHNIPIFADDLAKGPALPKLGVAAENVPFIGTAPGRLKQATAQQSAAARLVNDFSDGLEDFAVEAQRGLQNKLKSLKKIRRKMFDRAAQRLDPLGDVPLDRFKQTIQKQIDDELAKGSLANQNIIKTLEAFRDAPGGNFSTIRDIRNTLGNEISDFYKGDNKALGSSGVERLQAAKEALDQNIDDWVKATGGARGKQLFDQAMNFSRDRITVPFRKTALKKLVDTDQPEKIVSMLKSGATQATKGKKSFSIQVYNALDPKGRQAVQAEILAQAFNKATEGRKAFSANTFAGELEKIKNITGVFFRAKDRTRLNGLVKLMRATGRAGQVAENPPTGARLLIPGAVAGVATSPALTIGTATTFGVVVKGLLQSNIGKNLLFALGKVQPGTNSYAAIAAKLADEANKIVTRSAITESNQ